MTEMIKELFDGVTVFSLLREFSVITSLIIGVPLGYKLSKWLKNNFVFWGTPVGLISAFVACIMVPVGVINFTIDKGIDFIQYNLVELSKPKHIKYVR